MSGREMSILLAHALWCGACRDKLIQSTASVTIGRSLSSAEKAKLAELTADDFQSPNTVAEVVGLSPELLESYSDHPIVRLRHL